MVSRFELDMYIYRISIKGRYGWRTVTVEQFFKKFTMARRLKMVSDPSLSVCIDEFGELIPAEDSKRLLEELEAHMCVSVTDLAKFLQVYPNEGMNRDIVEQKLTVVMKDQEG